MEGIKKSRQNFENNPDNAIFGKDIQRIFNYIECYFLRLFLVGVVYLLILHTLFNIFVIAICVFLGLVSPLYISLFAIIRKIF